jgi:hypothetical protein
MTKAGAPVIFPQDREAAIYHNRAIWPFVSSYALLAAKRQEQAHIFNHLLESIINGAALNLSNMENFEFTTLKNYVNDGAKSGPVVNSQRQLWSVAGFISTYVDGIFGKKVENDSINFTPFITSHLRNSILNNTNSLELRNFMWKGKVINLKITLPPTDNKMSKNSFYEISEVYLNEKEVNKVSFHKYSNLKATNNFIISLKKEKLSFDKSKISNSNLYSDSTPWIERIEEEANTLKLHLNGARSYNIYQDNNLIKSSYSRSEIVLEKPESSTCFVIESSSVNKSFHSEPLCYWPKGSIKILNNYKKSGSIIKEFSIDKSGRYLLQAIFENSGDLATGITSSVKRVTIRNKNKIVHIGYLFLPHTTQASDSNFLQINLEKSIDYSLKIEDEFNMSYFDHFRTYVHRGGRSGSDNSAHIHSIKLLRSL